MKDIITIPRIHKIETLSPESLAGGLNGAAELSMGQAWLEKPDEALRPTSVRLAHDGEVLYVLADLRDEEVWTQATGDNQRLWTMGDVFELFLRDLSGDRYFELHVSPSGHRLQLCFPSTERFWARGWKLEEMMREDPLFEAKVETVEDGWRVAAAVPSTALFGHPLEGAEWLVSFSRYDYHADGRDPVLSSTSEHHVCNFHRQEEWRRLGFA